MTDRKDDAVLNLVRVVEENKDPKIVDAAIYALRRIGTDKAQDALRKFEEKEKSEERQKFEKEHMKHMMSVEEVGSDPKQVTFITKKTYLLDRDCNTYLTDKIEVTKDIGFCLTDSGLLIVGKEYAYRELKNVLTKDELDKTKDAIKMMMDTNPETNLQDIMKAVNEKSAALGGGRATPKKQTLLGKILRRGVVKRVH